MTLKDMHIPLGKWNADAFCIQTLLNVFLKFKEEHPNNHPPSPRDAPQKFTLLSASSSRPMVGAGSFRKTAFFPEFPQP